MLMFVEDYLYETIVSGWSVGRVKVIVLASALLCPFALAAFPS